MSEVVIVRVKNGFIIYDRKAPQLEADRYVSRGVDGALEILKGILAEMEVEDAA